MKRIAFIMLLLCVCIISCDKQEGEPSVSFDSQNKTNSFSAEDSSSEETLGESLDGETESMDSSNHAVAVLDDDDEVTEEEVETIQTRESVTTESHSFTPEETDFTKPDGEVESLSWEEFQELLPEAKDAYLHTFKDYEAFYEWMIAAQAEAAKSSSEMIEIGEDGKIDLEKLK